MNKYEAMVIVKSDLNEDQKKNLFSSINDVITKNAGTVTSSSVWSEKRKLTYAINKNQDGTYYLVNFQLGQENITKIHTAHKLNENIIRTLIVLQE